MDVRTIAHLGGALYLLWPFGKRGQVSEAHCPFMIRTEHLLQMALNISGDTLRRVVTIGATVLVRTGEPPESRALAARPFDQNA